jgi:glycosyltransferase involved in cell wall biosynthesis
MTVPSRVNNFFPKIINSLNKQIDSLGESDVELLALLDNKIIKVGTKRNMLLDMASGDFLVFVDDDDKVSDDYVSSILGAISSNPNADCIVFDSICTVEGGPGIYCKYGVEFEYHAYGEHPNRQWRGKPAHTMVFRSSIAKKYRFPGINYGEDIKRAKEMWREIKNQVRVNKILYYYLQSNETTEAGRRELP